MWNLLKESLARSEIYEKNRNGSVYPLPYWKTRWCENKQTAEWVAKIWQKYFTFVKHLMTLLKSTQPKNNKSYDSLITVVNDPLVCAKLNIGEMLLWKFKEVFSILLWGGLLWCLLEKFILKETLAKPNSGRKELKVKQRMSTFRNMLVKLILDLLVSFKLQNIKRK